MSSIKNRQAFSKALAENLGALHTENPTNYAWDLGELNPIVDRMMTGFLKGTTSNEGKAGQLYSP